MKSDLKAQILQSLTPREEPLIGRRFALPHKKLALIYQRQSTYEQKKKHIWSQADQDALVNLAREDGYPDDSIYVEKRDLGISGGKTAKDRPGLANLIQLVQQDKVESVWVVETTRLYRDQDYVSADGLALILRDHGVVVCTPRQVFNLANSKEWQQFHDEIGDAVKDTSYRAEKFSRTRMAKARFGLYVGTPIPAGYLVKKGNGETYDLIEPYPPHAAVAQKIFDAHVQANGSPLLAARNLSGVEFPFFPEELSHMATRTSLKRTPKTASGYKITPALVDSMVRNPFYIGCWVYGGQVISENGHAAIIDEATFAQAYELATRKGKPRGKSVYREHLPFTGLLWCGDHDVERRISAHSAEGRYLCDYDYHQGLSPSSCLDIHHAFLDTPIIAEVFRFLNLTGVLTEMTDEVVESLKEDINRSLSEQKRLTAKVKDLEHRKETYEWQLGETRDKDRIETIWQHIDACKKEIREKREQFDEAQKSEVTKEDILKVTLFLKDLRGSWDEQPTGIQNQLLRQLLEKVTLKRNHDEIEASIHWRTGTVQELFIRKPKANSGKERMWAHDEDETLRQLWPSASREAILSAFPNRTWSGTSLRALRLGLKRARKRTRTTEHWKPWTDEEDSYLTQAYQAGDPIQEICQQVNRSADAVESRASARKLTRPPRPNAPVEWEDLDARVGRLDPSTFMHDKSSCRGR